LTSTTTSGGKNARSSSPGSLAKPGEAFLEETLAPLGHDLTGQVQALANFFVAQTLSGKKNDLGAHDIAIRRRIFRRQFPQTAFFLAGQNDHERAIPGHGVSPFREHRATGREKRQSEYVIIFMRECT
jgi:hypothetical protein